MKLKKGSLNLKLALLMILLIPIFFGFRVEFLMPFSLQSTVFDIIIIVAASAGLLFFAYFIIIRTLDEEAIKIMHEHEVVNAFINKKAKPILINFSITMVLEELIFRFYIIGVLDLLLGYLIALILSSIIFSLYHLHFLLSFKNYKVLAIYLINAFVLGVLNGFIFYKLGLFCCIIVHYVVALTFYWRIAQQS